MSEMSRAQGPAHQDPNPTDDMVPPAAQVPDSYVESFGPRDSGSEDVGPQDGGAEDRRSAELRRGRRESSRPRRA